MSLIVTAQHCKGSYPISGDGLTNRLKGKDIGIPDPSIMLGGLPSGTSLYSEAGHPLVNAKPWANTVPPSGSPFNTYRIFRDISAAEATAGVTLYRGIYLSPDRTCTDLKVYASDGPGVGTLTLGTEALTTLTNGKGVQRIATEKTAPSGVVFSAPTSGSPLSLGSCAAGDVVFLWMKLVIPAGATPTMYDAFVLNMTDSSDASYLVTFHSVLKGIGSVTVAGVQDGGIVVHPFGDTYTISTFDSNGAAADPPSSTVMVYAVSSFNSAAYMGDKYGGNPSGTFLGQATKTTTGVYKFTFRPQTAGHYLLTFDCGGEIQSSRNVEVSPVP